MQSDRCFNVNSQTVRQLVTETPLPGSTPFRLDTVKPVRDLQLRLDPVGSTPFSPRLTQLSRSAIDLSLIHI